MASTTCKVCGATFPASTGPGRPRTRCDACAPGRKTITLVKPGPDGTIAGAVKTQLSAAGRIGTALGLTAVALAEQLDTGTDSGSQLAALAKQLGATLAEATKDAAVEVSPLDELRERRRQRG